ncbi:hypothetical protein STCU_11111 [Strigomonas culicis]|uniref:Uncharacterized protein n=1 Tax=Strigomonas culicis TaxID=28005 RepID=S9TJV0_9TRYP|nr:hypothetical protein STCU_11111 [Strigomonas culicis]|eukprot:EPY16613.1 hypothetical protein STCU_11111 [Strigomonas culicis]
MLLLRRRLLCLWLRLRLQLRGPGGGGEPLLLAAPAVGGGGQPSGRRAVDVAPAHAGGAHAALRRVGLRGPRGAARLARRACGGGGGQRGAVAAALDALEKGESSTLAGGAPARLGYWCVLPPPPLVALASAASRHCGVACAGGTGRRTPLIACARGAPAEGGAAACCPGAAPAPAGRSGTASSGRGAGAAPCSPRRSLWSHRRTSMGESAGRKHGRSEGVREDGFVSYSVVCCL